MVCRLCDRRCDQIADNEVKAALHRVCVDVAQELSLLGASITVMAQDDAEASVASSCDAAQSMAELQFATGEGPSTDAFKSGRPVLVPDLAASDGRWVAFTPAALASGASGVYAFPLDLGAAPLGVLTCYSTASATLKTAQLHRCLFAADVATSLLLSHEGPDLSGVLQADPAVQRSLHIRSEVYQAQGMLMVELNINLSDAMARLRAVAYAEGIDLNDLAADLVAGRREFPEMDLR